MNIRGLTPVAMIAGESFRFLLRHRDAFAWQSIDQLGESQQGQLLASCPEILVWTLTSNCDQGRFELRDLLQRLRERRSDCELENGETLSIRSFDTSLKKRFLGALEKCSDDESKETRVGAELVSLIENACELEREKVVAWFQGIAIPKGFWNAIAKTGKVKQGPSQIPIIDTRLKPGPEFEERLMREKMASMKQLAYGASHEINNPLANIASRAQTLLMDETDPDRRLRLAKINQQAFRANEMIADMMLFAHPPKPVFSMTDPVEVIRQVVSEMKPQAEQQETQIKTRLDQIKPFNLDKTQLAVAIKAMLTNSLESLGDSGMIEIHLRSSGQDQRSSLVIEVSDNGPGIAAEAMNHLFDPFFSGREAGRGLGFGLSKVWRIAELHGGEISAENPAHGGVRFCLRIPYREVA